MQYNSELFKLAEWKLQQLDKEAFTPPASAGGDPSGGPGGPPGADPSAMGAPPPGMDPSAGGGQPPPSPDPSGGSLDPNMLTQMITQAVQSAMGGMGGQPGQGGPGAMGAGGKPMKASLETVGMDIFQVKKLVMSMMNAMGLPLPQDILDGPNRDPSTGLPMMPGQAGSTSDPSQMAAQAQQQQPQGQAPGAAGGQQQGSAIPPVSPMQPAGPGAEATKSGNIMTTINKAIALEALFSALSRNK